MTLGEKIQFMRKKAGMSQEELAGVIGVSRQAISKWETGESTPEVGKLLALSRAFGVTADWLISDGGPDEPSGPDRYREEPRVEPREPERAAASEAWRQSPHGVLGALFQRFGWLSGVYVAVVGAIFTGVGALMRHLSEVFFPEPLGFSSNIPGEYFIGSADGKISFSMGEYTPVDPTAERIFNTVSGVAIGLGLVLLIGGIVLALVLRRYGQRE